mmetsp:Transcript_635/g.1003  ORF Transcript_635/g.1003 Transcript_635/m.1003 type:complete len:293 (-) Transcript_635:990-1868(-)
MFSDTYDGSFHDVENHQLLLNTPYSSTLSSRYQNNSCNILFRTLQPKDRDEIKLLHEEWFPVKYKDEFYDELVLQRMFISGDNLYTCAAVCTKKGVTCSDRIDDEGDEFEKDYIHSSAAVKNDCMKATDEEDRIAACVVGSYVEVARIDRKTVEFLVDDPTLHTHLFYIMTLGTIAEYRHCRLATKLIRRVMDEVEIDPQCGAIYLHVITFNNAAIRFYEKLGFYRVAEIKDYYTIDDERHNCYLYARYYNGNYGRRDYLYMVTNFVTTVWRHITTPFFGRSLTTINNSIGK